MGMTRTREAAATRLISKFERALQERGTTEARFKLALKEHPQFISTETLDALSKEKRTAERRFNMLRGTLWRALVASAEEL
jgi:hypothetical protein